MTGRKSWSEGRKSSHDASRRRAADRRADRATAQDERARKNRLRKISGEPTPWEQAKAERRERRRSA